MTINDFFTPADLQMIRNSVTAQDKFEVKKQVKGKKNKYTVTIDGRHIDKDLATDIWHGHDYLVGCNFDYHGQMGIGGKGWAMDVFPMLRSWEDFKEWFEKQIGTWPEYEIEEEYQMSLF